MAKYAISVSAARFVGNKLQNIATGSGVAEASDNTTAESVAMNYAKSCFKPGDGYDGHTVSVTEIKEEEAPKKHWFKFG